MAVCRQLHKQTREFLIFFGEPSYCYGSHKAPTLVDLILFGEGDIIVFVRGMIVIGEASPPERIVIFKMAGGFLRDRQFRKDNDSKKR